MQIYGDVGLQYWRPNDDPVIWLLAFVIGTIGNCDLLANIKWHHQNIQTFLVNLVAANILAVLCIPVHYLHQFCRGCGLGLPMRTAFWVSRDLATGVQIFSVVVFSAVRLQNILLRGKCVSLPTSVHADGSRKTSAGGDIAAVRPFTRDIPVFTMWIVAACYSLPAAVTSNTLCYIHSDDAFEDANTKRVAIFHSLAFRLIPLFCAVFLHILTIFKRRNSPYRIQIMDDSGKLLSWLIITVTINYIPLHGWLLHSWSQQTLLTTAAVDAAMYFPLYSTASCIPVVVYFTTATPRRGLIHTV